MRMLAARSTFLPVVAGAGSAPALARTREVTRVRDELLKNAAATVLLLATILAVAGVMVHLY